MTSRILLVFLAGVLLLASAMARAADPLPSWHDGPSKARIQAFVQAVTREDSADYVAPADRIAVFDNDGTLWAEQPMYMRDGRPAIVRLPEIDFIDDKAGKPVAIHKFIGKRPIAAFGNSDGDFEMLEYVTSAAGARLGLIVRHDDSEREWAYDRMSHVGRLDRALDEAAQRGWTITSMKREWKTIYPPGR